MNSNDRRHHRRPSFFFPLILIVIGIVLLLSNVGALRGDLWSNILNLWPVLLIAIGLDGIFRREGLVGATFMIGLGVVFLLANLGYLVLDVWYVVLRLWPVLLVAIGFDILIGRRSTAAAILGMVVILAILLSGLWLFGVQVNQGEATMGERISQPLGNATQAELIFELGAASFHLEGNDDPLTLVAGTIPSGMGVNQDFSTKDGRAVYHLNAESASFQSLAGNRSWKWDMQVNPEIPLDIILTLAAGNSNLDLSGLTITNLEVKTAVGETVVRLPEGADLYAQVDGAVGRIVIIVPQGASVRIQSSTGLAAVQVPDGFEKEGDVYLSEGFEGAEHKVNLKLEMAVGIVTVMMEE